MPRLQPKFRSLVGSLCSRLRCLAWGRSDYIVFNDQDDVGDDRRPPASGSTENPRIVLTFDDDEVTRRISSLTLLSSSTEKLELVNSDPPTVSVETIEEDSVLFGADDLDYIYYQMGTIRANPVPRERIGGMLQLPSGLVWAWIPISNHRRQCLHRIQRWNGKNFEDGVTLKDLGLRVQMGHPPGERCHNPMKAYGDAFVVIDTTGIHNVGVDFCCCETAIAPHLQLLRSGWFSDTSVGPKIAATFSLLEAFHLLSNQSKVSVFDFYISLTRRTDNTGVSPQHDCYSAFYFMVREWRRIKLMKRAGRGNDPGGIATTPLGACAVECPACPHPEMNLPKHWKSVPPKKSPIDANSRLGRMKLFSGAVNPGPDHARRPRCDHEGHDREQHCDPDDAMNLATIEGSSTLASTSVAAMDYSQHGIKLPSGIGGLQKEEHQAGTFPLSSDSEMTLGSGHDALDDLFGHQSWRKTTAMPAVLLSRINLAVHERALHVNTFKTLTCLIDSEHITKWHSMVKAWEADPKRAPNPYEANRCDLLQNALQAELTKQDAGKIREGAAGIQEYTVATMLMTGLRLEEQQHRLNADFALLGRHSSDFQRVKLLKERNELAGRIATFRDVQKLFTPIVDVWLPRFTTRSTAETVPLLLPSALCALGVTIHPDILDREWRLREAQAHDALAGLRVQLEVRASIFKYKNENAQVRKERVWWENTGSTSLIKSVNAEVGAAALRYRVAFSALSSLDVALDNRQGKHSLRELEDKDIQHISADDRSCSNRKISWIWLTSDVNLQDVGEEGKQHLHESLRIEWCKSRARALRWREQCKLLQEEMRRVIAFHGRKAEWWEDYVGRNYQEQPEYLEGANAYAYRQAAIRKAMGEHCRDAWRLVFVDVALGDTECSAPLCDGNNIDDDKESINTLSTLQAVCGDLLFERAIGTVIKEDSIEG
ncbi:hypothetical protein LXA43DRAFT_1067045 [Ganoderma leucocontextum]|nr:hypothetical protein LXA43DRAFT_1067045 [Ganoderma leucocontextum]